ncbi:J domain-containing protein [Marinobacter halotolerans]|uniref:J domain-containing protein n=1 Tax=Marinobacter halotolerans TaxID=1569211 RepID=UPI0012441A61|nr:J domain-containing protein [Marinobacter halotolerans]
MNCWEILGIEPTDDRRRIQDAYEQQLRFASGEETRRLEEAYREAVGDNSAPLVEEASESKQITEGEDRALDGNESQVVREVVIQIKALLNDSSRARDLGIWKAILNEPPADQPPLRREIGRQLEPQLRPMAENGNFPAPVAEYLGNWFGWFSSEQVQDLQDDPQQREGGRAEASDDQQPQMVNFWPAVVGWIVALAVLATLFSGMGGGG